MLRAILNPITPKGKRTYENARNVRRGEVRRARGQIGFRRSARSFPLEKENFADVLSDMKDKWGDTAFLASTDDGDPAGFFCYSENKETNEGMLKFVVVNPECRGKGVAVEMLSLITEFAFTERNADAVQLNVFPENARARKCYLKAGFVERSTTEDAFEYKDETWGRCNMVIRKNT